MRLLDGMSDATADRMRSFRALVQQHPVASYFALTFAISWGGILIVVGPTGILASPEVFDRMTWVPALLLGPSVAGIVMTALVAGRAGLRDYRARLLRWRVGMGWWAIALFTAPIYSLTAALLLSLYSRDFLPAIVTASDKVPLLIQGLVVGLSGGIFEELGWTGFAVPMLRRRHGPAETGAIVGVLWGAWHILPKLLGARAFDTVAFAPLDLLTAIIGLTAFRILMVWVYDRTRSLPVAMLMHAGLTAGLFTMQPAVTGASSVLLGMVQAIVAWVLVAIVALVRRSTGASGFPAATRSA